MSDARRIEELEAENDRLSRIASDWRDKANKQILLRVAADMRAGRKNVDKLEAENAELRKQVTALEHKVMDLEDDLAKLRAENEALRNPEPKLRRSPGCCCPRC